MNSKKNVQQLLPGLEAPEPTAIPGVSPVKELRKIDGKRLDGMHENYMAPEQRDTWYIHTVLAQCFLPYRDPKTTHWMKENGDVSIALTAGIVKSPEKGFYEAGLPYGVRPRLFLTYINTQAVLKKSPVIMVEDSMTAMMRELGIQPTGGKNGTIAGFKEQITRLAACHFRIIAPDRVKNTMRHINAEPFKSFDVWFSNVPEQRTLWPSEIVLTDDFYNNLVEHAIPYDFRGLKLIQNNPRAQDIFLWMTQRLCRLSKDKPLFMTWQMLYEMFGGTLATMKKFKQEFRIALNAAKIAYPDARLTEEENGFRFYASPPPVPKTKIAVNKPVG